MRTVRGAAGVAGWLVVLVLATAPAGAKTRVGEVASAAIASPALSGRPGSPAVWTHTIHHAGALFIKLHVASLSLGPDDRLRILDETGRVAAEYANREVGPSGFWAPAVPGDTLTVELASEAAGAAVTVDRYGHGTRAVRPASVCVSDQTEDVACHAGTPIAATSGAVGRMLFEQQGALFACTGFLVSAFDLFLSAHHCVSTQAGVDSLEVTFDYQARDCGGKLLEPARTYAGDQLVTASAPFDMALMSLAGGPAARHGYLPLSTREPTQGEPLYLPQHPNGDLKKVSVAGCQVSTPQVDGGAPGSDFGHQCDTEPGSSGSPVLDLDDQVVGLHHIGGCGGSRGENLAVLMSRIRPLLPLPATAFAVKSARITPAGGFLTLRGKLTLGLDSALVDPLAEPITVTVADADGPVYVVTLPAGAMRPAGATFLFRAAAAQAPNGLRNLRLIPRGAGVFEVVVTVRRADLSGADRAAITVSLAIGGESGSHTVLLRQVPQGFLLP